MAPILQAPKFPINATLQITQLLKELIRLNQVWLALIKIIKLDCITHFIRHYSFISLPRSMLNSLIHKISNFETFQTSLSLLYLGIDGKGRRILKCTVIYFAAVGDTTEFALQDQFFIRNGWDRA